MVRATEEDMYYALPIHNYKPGREVVIDLKRKGKSICYGRFYTTMRRLGEQGYVECRDDSDNDGNIRSYKRTSKGRPIKEERLSLSSLDNILNPA